MTNQEQQYFGDLFDYAIKGVDRFKRKNADLGENPYDQILEELDERTDLNVEGPQTVQNREDAIYHFAGLPALSENILGKHGLRLEEDSLRKEIEYLSDSYEQRDSMNHEELFERQLAAEGMAKIFKEINQI